MGTRLSVAQTDLPACFRERFGTSLICLLFLLFAGCTHNTNPGTTPPVASPGEISSSAQVVKVSTPPVSIPVNGSVDANVMLSISPGFHINANPATFPYLIATEVQHTVDPDSGLPFMGKPIYPPPVNKNFAFAEQPLAVYEGEITIKLPLRSPRPGECYNCYLQGAHLSFPITTRVQACDHDKCYPPANIENTIPINVN